MFFLSSMSEYKLIEQTISFPMVYLGTAHCHTMISCWDITQQSAHRWFPTCVRPVLQTRTPRAAGGKKNNVAVFKPKCFFWPAVFSWKMHDFVTTIYRSKALILGSWTVYSGNKISQYSGFFALSEFHPFCAASTQNSCWRLSVNPFFSQNRSLLRVERQQHANRSLLRVLRQQHTARTQHAHNIGDDGYACHCFCIWSSWKMTSVGGWENNKNSDLH